MNNKNIKKSNNNSSRNHKNFVENYEKNKRRKK